MPDNEAEIIEAMARALSAAGSKSFAWEGLREDARDEFRRYAKAALAASPIERLQGRVADLEQRGAALTEFFGHRASEARRMAEDDWREPQPRTYTAREHGARADTFALCAEHVRSALIDAAEFSSDERGRYEALEAAARMMVGVIEIATDTPGGYTRDEAIQFEGMRLSAALAGLTGAAASSEEANGA